MTPNLFRIWVLAISATMICSCQPKNETAPPPENGAATSAGYTYTTSPEGQPIRPKDFTPFRYEYTIEELYEQFSENMMKRAAEEVEELSDINANGPYQPTIESLNSHSSPEWFDDAKLGIFLDWGPWSVPGYASPRDPELGTGGSYPDWYEFLMDYSYKAYHDSIWGADFRRDDFLPLLNGSNFDAEAYATLATQAGAKYLIPFCRHHGGWTMWESEFTKRNAMEMGPKRDIYKELAEAAREQGLKLGFYFSVAEWEYPVIVDQRLSQWDPNENLAIFQDGMALIPRPTPHTSFFPVIHDRMLSGKIPVRDYYADYMMPLFKEGVDKFDPDIVWYDGGWGTPATVSRAPELSAYFYNQAEGRKEVVINNRAGSYLSPEKMAEVQQLMASGNHEQLLEIYLGAPRLGDYTTPEYTIGEVDPTVKWEVCRSISPAFGYNWTDNADNSLSSKELIDMFVGIVAGNGNLLLVINPDATGKLSEIQKSRLTDLGEWLKVNGEGIYATRPWEIQEDGSQFFTQSKDGKFVYVHCTEWPGNTLKVKSLTPLQGSAITMLGVEDPMEWTIGAEGLEITIPPSLQAAESRPNPHGWSFKVPVQ